MNLPTLPTDLTPTPSGALVAGLVPNPYARRILFALNVSGRHVYGGTVSGGEKARRRAAGKAARKARQKARA